MKALKLLFIVSAAFLIAGCKLAVMVNEGGTVQHSGGECAQGSVCTIPIRDESFSRSFTAVPKPGYQFVKWNTGGLFFCAGSTNPNCTLSFPDNAAAEAVIALFETGYIMPVFKDVGFDPDSDGLRNELDQDDDNDGILDADDACPLNPNTECTIDSLFVNGKEWAQPDLFRGVSMDEINAVCPEGVCAGALSGGYSYTNEYNEQIQTEWTYNLSGWMWASESEIIDLFDYYRGDAEAFGCLEYDKFLADGWRVWIAPSLNIEGTYGQVRDRVGGEVGEAAVIRSSYATPQCVAFVLLPAVSGAAGGWFYRAP